jgi:hypothetical protein
MSAVMSSGEAFFVAKVDNDPGGTSGPLHWGWGSDTAGSHWPFAGDNQIYDTFGTTSRKTVGDPTPALTTMRVYNVRSATNAWSAHLDGTQIFSTATNTTGWGTGTHNIGFNPTAQRLKGYIAEIILYSSVLSSGDRSIIHAYLNSKYGFSLP